MSDFNSNPLVQLELFPEGDASARSKSPDRDRDLESEKNSKDLPPDYWLKVSNKLMKKLDRELQAMPPAMRKATISEMLHLMAQML